MIKISKLKYFNGKEYVEPKMKIFDNKQNDWVNVGRDFKRLPILQRLKVNISRSEANSTGDIRWNDNYETASVVIEDGYIYKIQGSRDRSLIVKYAFSYDSNSCRKIKTGFFPSSYKYLYKYGNLYSFKGRLYFYCRKDNVFGEIDKDTLYVKWTRKEKVVDVCGYGNHLYIASGDLRKYTLDGSKMNIIVKENSLNAVTIDSTGIYCGKNRGYEKESLLLKYNFNGILIDQYALNSLGRCMVKKIIFDKDYIYLNLYKSDKSVGYFELIKVNKKTKESTVTIGRSSKKIYIYDDCIYFLNNKICAVDKETGNTIINYRWSLEEYLETNMYYMLDIQKYKDKLIMSGRVSSPTGYGWDHITVIFNPYIYTNH